MPRSHWFVRTGVPRTEDSQCQGKCCAVRHRVPEPGKSFERGSQGDTMHKISQGNFSMMSFNVKEGRGEHKSHWIRETMRKAKIYTSIKMSGGKRPLLINFLLKGPLSQIDPPVTTARPCPITGVIIFIVPTMSCPSPVPRLEHKHCGEGTLVVPIQLCWRWGRSSDSLLY